MRQCMNQKIAVFCILLFSLFGNAFVANAQATNLHDAAAQLTKKLHDDPDVQRISGEHIVIAPFENINGKGDAVPRILQEMLTTSFIKAKHFKVLERDQLQSALDELHFQLSDLADPAKAKKIGKLAGAAYVLLGSISDTGSSTSVNARIVSIESSESIAAEDVDIKTGDLTPGAGDLNPAPLTPPAPVDILNPAKPTASAIDLNAKSVPTSAGQFTGKKDNFGLLGGTKFQVAWRENLGKDPVYSFSAGDVLGDGGPRLVMAKLKAFDANPYAVLSVQKWINGKFQQTWESPALGFAQHGGNSYVRILPMLNKPSSIYFSDLTSDIANGRDEAVCFVWDGTNYDKTFSPMAVVSTDAALSKNLVGIGLGRPCLIKYNPDADVNQLTSVGREIYTPAISTDAVAADFDGDGKMEFAVAYATDINFSGKSIEIYGLDGTRKAITSAGYGARLAVWNPTGSKLPFLVARRNTAEADGKPNGGYIYFIHWNGESYEEVWKSNQMDDAVIDMQVCDPKGEGKTGLVVLSSDKNGYYLTKIVPTN